MAAVLLATLTVTTGCSSTQYVTDLNKRLTSLAIVEKRPPNATYTVDPPDAIRVEFMDEPTLTREVVLRSDGSVTLPLVYDVNVGGLTTEQIRQKLETLYAKYYKEVHILITVTAFQSKHIYVYGEVPRQGIQPYMGSQTVGEVIGIAGGVTTRAATGRVRVIRGDPKDPEIYRVDLDSIIHDGAALEQVSLSENDVVYVPPTVLAWVGYQMEQVTFPLQQLVAPLITLATVRSLSGGNRGGGL
jgi:polysaccharide export outer membrane protein